MPIPASGQFNLSQIETELTGSSGYQQNLNEASVRLFASLGNNDGVLVNGSEIRWSMFFSKGVIKLTNSAATNNFNIRASSNTVGYGAAYTAGKTLINFTNNSDIGSTSTAVASLRTGSFTSGDKVYITNSTGAKIIGKGGDGGAGQTRAPSGFPPYSYGVGSAGGSAMNLTFACVVQNNGTVASGGNGGAGGNGNLADYPYYTNPAGRTYGVAAGGGGGGGGAGIVGGAGGGGGIGYEDYYGNPNNAGSSGGSGSSAGAGGGNTGGYITNLSGNFLGYGPSGSNGTGLGSSTAVTGYNTYATWSGNPPSGSVT